MESYIVGGTFDKDGGKPSYIVGEIAKETGFYPINGGNLNQLQNFDFSKVQTIIWMPNVSNDEAKILPDIKKANQKLLLVSSKRAIEKDYKESDVIGHLLANKSNLGIMITKEDKYNFKLLDPLGNIWADTISIPQLCTKMLNRLDFLGSLTRFGSEKIGELRPFDVDLAFLKIIQRFGNEFTNYVNAVNPNRFLGNAATRCSYGFPSTRKNNRIFVTRRNVDKTSIQANDFVEVEPKGDKVGYYGDNKPSVDTPIQLKLFEQYPNVNYMIHGHVYAQESPFTGWMDTRKPATSKIPCGCIEEIYEIEKLFPERSSWNFTVNLFGHGFLAFAKDLEYFDKIMLRGRPFPETV